MDQAKIEGVLLNPLKKILHPQGDIYHGLKKSDPGFLGFSEAYFSTILSGEIKAWKKHLNMTSNLIVPHGEIRFVLFDDRPGSITKGSFFDISLSIKNYYRLTVPPNVWMAFKGIGENHNLLLNIANLEHDPNEIVRKEFHDIQYIGWTK